MARQSALALGVVLIASMAASCTCGTRKQHAVSRNSKGTALGKKAQHKRVRRVVVTRQQQHWLWRRVWRQTQNLREQIRTGYGVTPKRTIAHVLRDASVAGQSREYRDLLDDLRRNLVALQETPEVVRLYNNVIDVCAKCHSKFSKKELPRVNALRLEDPARNAAGRAAYAGIRATF